MNILLASLLAITPTVLPPPDFQSKPVGAIAKPRGIDLKLVSSKPNEITDDEAWLARNELTVPTTSPESLPREFEGWTLIKAIPNDDRLLLIYGQDYGSGRLLVAQSRQTKEILYALDFSSYEFAPKHADGEKGFVGQQIVWARQIGDVLYVSHGHNTYARSSMGMNAYVSAIDVRKRKALWHSAPLVSNAANFEIDGDYLITGYGFTAEPDFLYLLRRDTGKAVARIPVKSGPSYILKKGHQLYVRTYNTDYVFKLVK